MVNSYNSDKKVNILQTRIQKQLNTCKSIQQVCNPCKAGSDCFQRLMKITCFFYATHTLDARGKREGTVPI